MRDVKRLMELDWYRFEKSNLEIQLEAYDGCY